MKDTGKIIMLFIGIIVVVSAFVPTIFTTQNKMTDKQAINNESYNLTTSCYTTGGEINESNSACNYTVENAPTGWEKNDPVCYISSVTVGNATDDPLTESTDYNLVADEGIIQILNTTDTTSSSTGELILVDYSYCEEGYNPDAASRSVASLIGLFAVLALLAFVIVVGIKEWINQ